MDLALQITDFLYEYKGTTRDTLIQSDDLVRCIDDMIDDDATLIRLPGFQPLTTRKMSAWFKWKRLQCREVSPTPSDYMATWEKLTSVFRCFPLEPADPPKIPFDPDNPPPPHAATEVRGVLWSMSLKPVSSAEDGLLHYLPYLCFVLNDTLYLDLENWAMLIEWYASLVNQRHIWTIQLAYASVCGLDSVTDRTTEVSGASRARLILNIAESEGEEALLRLTCFKPSSEELRRDRATWIQAVIAWRELKPDAQTWRESAYIHPDPEFMEFARTGVAPSDQPLYQLFLSARGRPPSRNQIQPYSTQQLADVEHLRTLNDFVPTPAQGYTPWEPGDKTEEDGYIRTPDEKGQGLNLYRTLHQKFYRRVHGIFEYNRMPPPHTHLEDLDLYILSRMADDKLIAWTALDTFFEGECNSEGRPLDQRIQAGRPAIGFDPVLKKFGYWSFYGVYPFWGGAYARTLIDTTTTNRPYPWIVTTRYPNLSAARKDSALRLVLDTDIEVDVSRLGPFVHWIRTHKPEFAPRNFDFDAFVRNKFPRVQKIWSLSRYKRREVFEYDPIQWSTLCLTIEPAKKLERELDKETPWNVASDVQTYVATPTTTPSKKITPAIQRTIALETHTSQPQAGNQSAQDRMPLPRSEQPLKAEISTTHPEPRLIERLIELHTTNSRNSAAAALTLLNQCKSEWSLALQYKSLQNNPLGPLPTIQTATEQVNVLLRQAQEFWTIHRASPMDIAKH
ncbi:hypothetical protein LTR66_004030 [Elasticomyces elasticus]|nr:hypothetical protein LTR66_004030 [Elasticomyces elasticus]